MIFLTVQLLGDISQHLMYTINAPTTRNTGLMPVQQATCEQMAVVMM